MSDPATIAAAIDEVAPTVPPDTFYDIARKEYLFPLRDSSGWLAQNESQIKRHLLAAGFDYTKAKGQNLSPLDKAIIELQMEHGVAYSGPLAGYRAGPYFMQGKRILVTSSPELAPPRPGDWPLIRFLLDSLLADRDFPQRMIHDAWLKMFLHALYEGQPRTGQAIAFCGPRDCGKSLWQNLLTRIVGGRAAKPIQYARGESGFNADLFHAEHLMIEDESPSSDMRSRRLLGDFIKGIAANEVHRLHAKNRDAVSLEPCWRLTISCNNEPEKLLTLPPLDESLMDKFILLKCSPPDRPFTEGAEARRKFWQSLVDEIPAYVHHLLRWEIPGDIAGERFGVEAFHHPALVEAIAELSLERQLLNLIDVAGLFPSAKEPWIGTALELERWLREDETTRREADRLFSWRTACGVFLSRLAKSDPHRLRRVPRGADDHQRWEIYPVGTFPPGVQRDIPF